MSDRCLQSLAILLAGLFSAERLRSDSVSGRTVAPGAVQEPNEAVAARIKQSQH
ncbi:MAG TPA: hypothetical protein VJV79_13230 [Polyangiaceae bacterium]|nr:hypothetical protein [Polyangiaceae bacterium]